MSFKHLLTKLVEASTESVEVAHKRKQSNYAFGWGSIVIRTLLLVMLVLWGLVLWQRWAS